jgi:hypothetical protein
VVSKVNETESHGVTILVKLDLEAGDGSEGRKDFSETFLSPVLGEVLGVQVGPLVSGSAVLTAKESSNEDLLVLEHVSIDLLDSLLGSLSSLVMDISVSLGHASLISGNLARQDVSEHGKEIEKSLVVHSGGKVLHENVTDSRLTDGGVTLGPHDTARATLDISEVHSVKSTLSILDIVEVHVSVSERTTSDSITAHSDGCHGTDSVEHLEEETLSDLGMQVTHIE